MAKSIFESGTFINVACGNIYKIIIITKFSNFILFSRYFVVNVFLMPSYISDNIYYMSKEKRYEITAYSINTRWWT